MIELTNLTGSALEHHLREAKAALAQQQQHADLLEAELQRRRTVATEFAARVELIADHLTHDELRQFWVEQQWDCHSVTDEMEEFLDATLAQAEAYTSVAILRAPTTSETTDAQY